MNPRYVIAVPDLARSAAFYADVLGFDVHETGDPGWRFFVRDRCFIMAGECPDATPPSELGDHSWFAYVEVDDIDALHDAVATNGAEVIAAPVDEPWGMREFGIRTVDGHRIRFGSPREARPTADGPTGGTGGADGASRGGATGADAPGVHDRDLVDMSRERLIDEARRLRHGIREHRDSIGHDLCWHHPALWSLLPERTDPLPPVPPWPEFLEGCLRYRRSLDEELGRRGEFRADDPDAG